MSIIGEATFDAFKPEILEKLDKEIQKLKQDPDALIEKSESWVGLKSYLKVRDMISKMYY